VERNEYILTDSKTSRDIDMNRPWEHSFYPGQRVDMSMVLSNAVTTTSSCPELRSSQELLVDRDNKSKFGNDFEGQVDVYDDSMFSQPSSSCP
jgi:hypothetical protein